MKSVDEAIFIHRIPYSETSLITSFYTKEGGLRKFLFKGGRKKSHQLFPLSYSELQFYGRPESELLNLTNVEPAAPSDFQFHPVKSTIAFFLADILKMTIRSEEPDQRLFEFLKSKSIELNETSMLGFFPSKFLIEFTEYLGISPLIISNERGVVFDLTSGTIGSVPAMNAETASGPEVDVIIATLENEPIIETDKDTREQILRILLDYYKIHIPGFKEPKTFEIVKEVLG